MGLTNAVEEGFQSTLTSFFHGSRGQLQKFSGAGAELRMPEVNEEFADILISRVRCSVSETGPLSHFAEGHPINADAQNLTDGCRGDRRVIGDRPRVSVPWTGTHGFRPMRCRVVTGVNPDWRRPTGAVTRR